MKFESILIPKKDHNVENFQHKNITYIVCKNGEYGIMCVDLSKMLDSSEIAEYVDKLPIKTRKMENNRIKTNHKEVETMLFQDKLGHIFTSEEIDKLEPWEVEDLGVHVYKQGEV